MPRYLTGQFLYVETWEHDSQMNEGFDASNPGMTIKCDMQNPVGCIGNLHWFATYICTIEFVEITLISSLKKQENVSPGCEMFALCCNRRLSVNKGISECDSFRLVFTAVPQTVPKALKHWENQTFKVQSLRFSGVLHLRLQKITNKILHLMSSSYFLMQQVTVDRGVKILWVGFIDLVIDFWFLVVSWLWYKCESPPQDRRAVWCLLAN